MRHSRMARTTACFLVGFLKLPRLRVVSRIVWDGIVRSRAFINFCGKGTFGRICKEWECNFAITEKMMPEVSFTIPDFAHKKVVLELPAQPHAYL